MKNNKIFAAGIMTATLIFGTVGCGQSVDEEVIASVEETTEDTVEAVAEAAEDVVEETAEAADEMTETAETSGPELDFAGAAEALGVTEQEIMEAFGDPNDGPPEMSEVAEKLGTTEEILSELFDFGTMDVSTIVDPYDVEINGITFEVTQPMYDWDEIPESISVDREEIVSYTNENGETHWYEVVYVSTCNVDWYQYAYLAEQAGGYLACLETEGENEFVFSLIDDDKYFWAFPEDGEHYGIKIGPVLGGYQPEGSIEPAGGWTWLSGVSFEDSYVNWAVNLDDGVIDKDPRDNTQPNDSADGQPIMGFGELNVPVSTWGDYTASQTNPQGIVRGSYACIIEYETEPVNAQ